MNEQTNQSVSSWTDVHMTCNFYFWLSAAQNVMKGAVTESN